MSQAVRQEIKREPMCVGGQNRREKISLNAYNTASLDWLGWGVWTESGPPAAKSAKNPCRRKTGPNPNSMDQ